MGKLDKNLEYPYNLLKDLGLEGIDVTEDRLKGLEYALSTFTEKKRTLVKLRYLGKKNYAEIGRIVGMSNTCVTSSIGNVLRKIIRSNLKNYIVNGYSKYLSIIDEAKRMRVLSQAANRISLVDADFSVRIADI